MKIGSFDFNYFIFVYFFYKKNRRLPLTPAAVVGGDGRRGGAGGGMGGGSARVPAAAAVGLPGWASGTGVAAYKAPGRSPARVRPGVGSEFFLN